MARALQQQRTRAQVHHRLLVLGEHIEDRLAAALVGGDEVASDRARLILADVRALLALVSTGFARTDRRLRLALPRSASAGAQGERHV